MREGARGEGGRRGGEGRDEVVRGGEVVGGVGVEGDEEVLCG